jgi:hypothetical protein
LVAAAVLEARDRPPHVQLEASWSPSPDDRRPGHIVLLLDAGRLGGESTVPAAPRPRPRSCPRSCRSRRPLRPTGSRAPRGRAPVTPASAPPSGRMPVRSNSAWRPRSLSPPEALPPALSMRLRLCSPIQVEHQRLSGWCRLCLMLHGDRAAHPTRREGVPPDCALDTDDLSNQSCRGPSSSAGRQPQAGQRPGDSGSSGYAVLPFCRLDPPAPELELAHRGERSERAQSATGAIVSASPAGECPRCLP